MKKVLLGLAILLSASLSVSVEASALEVSK